MTTIDVSYVKQFSSNIIVLAQQKGSKLRDKVRNETQRGESAFYERIGSTEAVKRTGRHQNTPQIDMPHSRRRVTIFDYEWASLIDDQDKLRMIIDPASEYAQAAAWALGRQMDDTIIEAALGTAYSGKEGATPVNMANANKLAAFDGSTTTGVGMNVETLLAAGTYFDENEIDPSMKKYMVLTPKGIEQLLNNTEVASADFNTVKALVMGDVNTFAGFEFIKSNKLALTTTATTYTVTNGVVGAGGGTLSSGAVRGFAWCMDGILFAIAEDIVGKISERDDKGYAMQIYARATFGGTRLEEEKVLELLYKV
jgi:hypothetical protein